MRVCTDAADAPRRDPPPMQREFQGLRSLVNVKAHAPCPMCGQEQWAGGDRITEVGSVGEVPIETMPFICVNCGFVRLHAIQPLETLDD